MPPKLNEMCNLKKIGSPAQIFLSSFSFHRRSIAQLSRSLSLFITAAHKSSSHLSHFWKISTQLVNSYRIAADTIENGEDRGGCSIVVGSDGGGGVFASVHKLPRKAAHCTSSVIFKQLVLNSDGYLV